VNAYLRAVVLICLLAGVFTCSRICVHDLLREGMLPCKRVYIQVCLLKFFLRARVLSVGVLACLLTRVLACRPSCVEAC
jgi:hypothetical protein